MNIRVAGGGAAGEAFFYSNAARAAGSISVAHGLNRTPKVVVVVPSKAAAGLAAQGSHDSTNLAINCGSSGATYTIFAM